MGVNLTRIPTEDQDILKAYCIGRLNSLRSYRYGWWSHWASLAEMYLPRRYRFFTTPNNLSRGSPINNQIVDETGLLAARTLATGMLSGLTSPTKPWFRLGLMGIGDIPDGPVKEWLAECTRRMLAVYAESNLYEALGQAYHDNVVFGSAALIQYEDPEDVIRFYYPPLGEFYFGLNNRLLVDTLYREFTYTAVECVQEFKFENCSTSVQGLYESGSSKDTEIVIGHAIEPNTPIFHGGREMPSPVPSSFEYREVHWEYYSGGGADDRRGHLLRVTGFKECPFVGFRWDVTSNDAYGRSPGMDALPAVRQLQIETRRKAQGIDKLVNPPLVGSVSMKNEPMDTLPGGVSFVADPNAAGFKPVYQVNPNITEMREDMQEVRERVRQVFFNDLFVRFIGEEKVQTATWVDAAREEKLVLLGPVIERTENEDLDHILDRTFAIMSRRGLLPPPPPEIQGMAVSVEYISFLAEAQRAASTSSIERLASFVGSYVGIKPDIIDNIDTDEMVSIYGDLLNTEPRIIRALAQVMAIRQARDAAQQQAAALQVGMEAVNAGKTLSDTQVGGGQNALQAMLGQAA